MQMYYVILKQEKCKLNSDITKYEKIFKFTNNRLLFSDFIFHFFKSRINYVIFSFN